VGVVVTSPVRREADGMGRLTHIFSIVDPNSVGGPVECHHGAEPQLVPLAPPRSHFLGNDGTDVLYWLTPAGAVVRTSAAPPPPPSRGVQAVSLCPTSFCLALASFSVLVFSLVVGVAIGLSGPAVTGTSLIGFARAPHDPGEFLSRRGFRGGDGFSLALPILVMYMCLPILLPAFLKLTFFVASRCRLRPATPSSLGFAR